MVLLLRHGYESPWTGLNPTRDPIFLTKRIIQSVVPSHPTMLHTRDAISVDFVAHR